MQKPPSLSQQTSHHSQQVHQQQQSCNHQQHHQGVVGVVNTNVLLHNNNNNNNNMNNNNSDSYGAASSSMSATSSSSSHHQQQQQQISTSNSINISTKSNKKESKTKRKSKSLPNSSSDQLSSSDDKKKRGVEATVSPSISSGDSEDLQAKNKKQRLSWTNELHQSFVEAVCTLGLDNAAPKAIKNLMGASHVTTDHIKSHLQKYRLQIKKGDELLPPSKETPETKEITEPTPQETTPKTGKKKKKKSITSNTDPSPVKEEQVETISVKNVEVISENLNNEVKNLTQQSNSNSMEQSSNSRSNSIGFNNWNFNSNNQSNSIPSIYELHNNHVEKEHDTSLLDHAMNNDASNSNFSFLKKSFLDNSQSFHFDNSQSGFLVLPSLSNLGGDEPTSNHLPVFAEKEERSQHLPSSFGFNVNSKSSFLSETTSHPTNLPNNPPPPPQNPQSQNEQCISFTNSSLQHYSSMLADMCRTDDEIRQLFIEAKNSIKADEHFLLLLLGYRLGVLSEKRSKK